MSAIATLICAALIWPFVSMWRAYCLLIMWAWFVTPATSIAPPSMYLLVGCLMTLHLMLPIKRVKKEDGDPFANYLSDVFTYGLAWPALALLCAWVWRWLQWGIA